MARPISVARCIRLDLAYVSPKDRQKLLLPSGDEFKNWLTHKEQLDPEQFDLRFD